MQRVAARLGECAPSLAVETGFLNYGEPTVADCISRLTKRGMRRATVQPYFLTTGQYVQQDLPRQLKALRAVYPALQYRLAPVLGVHASIPGLLYAQLADWRRALAAGETAGVVLAAHGSRFAQSVDQVEAIAVQLQDICGRMPVVAGYLDINRPDLATSCRMLLRQGVDHLAMLPCFLHAGRHVKEDLPRISAAVADEFPDRKLALMDPLEDVTGLTEIVLSQLSPCAAVPRARR